MHITHKIFAVGILFTQVLFSCGTKNHEEKKDRAKDSLQTEKDSIVKTTPTLDTVDNIVTDPNITDIKIDPNASPENVVKTMIKAAKTHQYGLLHKICNESIQMDGDAKDICGIANSTKQHQDEFDDFFGNAKIIGKPRVKNGVAEVDIETTAEGGTKETIVVQVKYDKWYLQGL
jgi:hypothetical protein